MPAEVVSVSADEAVVLVDGVARTWTDLSPSTTVRIDGLEVTTLPRPGARLATIVTTNDVHFGETECGRLGDTDIGPIFSVADGAEPYPAMMNRLAVDEIDRCAPDAVVVKGDLTDAGRPEEYAAFLACYARFGARLAHVRGNHDCGAEQDFAAEPFQEITVAGATVALLDTSRPGYANGTLSAEQIEAVDELGARADRPVLVMGHHPVWTGPPVAHDDAAVFGILPAPSAALTAVLARRPRLVAYACGHTHRTHVTEVGTVPHVEVAALKDFPGAWCEYQVHDGGILQVVRRVAHPDALAWTERTRAMVSGAYGDYAYGSLAERCRLIPVDRR